MSDHLQPVFRTGRWTFLLDGRVVETFHEGTDHSTRYLVDLLRIDGEPDGAGLKIRWGIEVSGRITNGGKAALPAAEIPAFQAFVTQALANRTTT